MFRPFRELQWRADCIRVEDFPRNHSFGTSPKNSKDFEGQRIRSNSFSDRIIFMSMFNDIDLDKKGTKTLALSIREKSKCMRQDSLTDTGYSWVPEKKASGIKDMQSIVVNGNSVLRQMWRNSRILERSKYYPLQVRVRQHWFSFQNCPCGESALYLRSSHKAVWKSSQRQILERQAKANQKVLEEHPEKLRSSRKNASHRLIFREYRLTSRNRMLQNLENSESMPFMSKIASLQTAAKFHHPIETENYFVTTLLEDDGWKRRTSMWKEYTALRNQKDSRPFASIEANQKIDPILIHWNCFDCWCSRHWGASTITEWSMALHVDFLTSRGKEIFVNEIHRHKNRNCKWKFLVAHEGRKLGKREFRICQRCLGKPWLCFSRFRYCEIEW